MTRRNHPAWLRRLGVLAVTATAAATLAACGGSDGESGSSAGSGETTKLRFSYFGGQNDPHGRLWQWWMDEIEQRSDGKVEFEAFFDGTLLAAPEVVDGLASGRVDVAAVAPTYYPKSFPVTNVAELPFVTENVPAASQAFAELIETSKPLQEEWSSQGMHVLAFNAGPGSAIGSKDPIRNAGDLDGKRLRALDRGSKILAEAGANLVNVGLTELYGAMERGLVNGYYGVPFAFAGPTKLVEVTNHLTDPGIGLAAMSAVATSSATWDRMPEDVKRTIAEVSTQVPAQQAKFLAAAEDETCAGARENDVEISVLPDAEIAKLRQGQERIRDEWFRETAARNLPGEEFYAEYTAAIEKASADFPDYETGLKRCLASDGSATR